MLVLGIIACKALEDELAHVLSDDHDLRHLILIDNPDCFDLSRKLRSRNRSHLLAACEEIIIVVNVLTIALHIDSKILRAESG